MIQLQNGESLNLPYTLRLSNCWNLVIEMWKTGKTSFLNNVDYLRKGIKDEVLRGNILEVVLSVTIKDANAVAICASVAELMI